MISESLSLKQKHWLTDLCSHKLPLHAFYCLKKQISFPQQATQNNLFDISLSSFTSCFNLLPLCPSQPQPDMERHAAPLCPDVQTEPAPWRSPPMEEERCWAGVQPLVWLRCFGRGGNGENGKGVENSARTLSLCGRIHSGTPVSHTHFSLNQLILLHFIFLNGKWKNLWGSLWRFTKENNLLFICPCTA